MLINNNPDIDFDTLNARIVEQLEHYQKALGPIEPPKFDIKARPACAITPIASDVAELLALEDREFIEQAYMLLLKRPADPEGLEHYLIQLQNGEEKSQIITSLLRSPEGQKSAGLFSGLHKQTLKRGLSNLPVIGKLFATLLALTTAHPFRRYINARFNHFYRQAKEHHIQLDAHHIQLDAHHIRLDDIQKQIHLLTDDQRNQRQQITKLHDELTCKSQQMTDQQKTLAQLRLRIHALETLYTAAPSTQAPATEFTPTQTVSSQVEDTFYVAFEEHFRGDTNTITSRLQYYVPLLHANKTLNASGLPTADIGCGRGEWLNILKQQKLKTIGIDLNALNVSLCKKAGHQALQTDGLNWLQQQPNDSLALISAFHVIEHLTFTQLNLLLTEALRVLAPGGMLILETPNPENLITGTTQFYTDPTHLHPLPPAFTEFMVNFKGFSDVKLHRLNPIPTELALPPESETARRCNELFYGPQDYAVVAVKPLLDD